MPRDDESTYAKKQKRQAEHIEEGYERRGISHQEAERRAWAIVNKETGRKEERLRPRQESKPRILAQGRPSVRPRGRDTPGSCAFALVQESGGQPQAPRGTVKALGPHD